MLMETINVCELVPSTLTHSNLTLPPRTLAIINAQVELRENPQEQTYNVKPNSLLSYQYSDMVVIPTIHITPKQANTMLPF